MNVAIYVRVSTKNHDQNPEVQFRELREHCQRQGWNITGEYVDKMSGKKSRRPGLDRLMSDAADHVFDTVLVWRWSRFARSTKDLLLALEKFQDLGIAFKSVAEGTDTSTPAGKMMFTILGAIATFEGEIIVENIKSGLANARATGEKLGRPKGPGKKFRHPNLDIESVRRRRAAGEKLRHIAESMKVSHTYLWKLLKKNPA